MNKRPETMLSPVRSLTENRSQRKKGPWRIPLLSSSPEKGKNKGDENDENDEND